MMDPKPLLSHPEKADSEAAPPALFDRNRQYPSLDDTIEWCIGEFGWAQFIQATLISFAWLFDAQQTFISVFTDAQPKWSCNDSHSNSCSNISICELPRESWSWDLPAFTSTVSEWSLECKSAIITALPASSFFMGCLAGGFVLATLADSNLGRKNMLVLSSFIMSLSGLLAAGSVNVWMYAALRFLSGFGRATIGTCALVLSTELVGKKWRGNVGIIGFICFDLGFLSLPIVAYLLRGYSWRLIYLWTCIPSVLYSILLYFAVHESPRWFFIRGRKEEFVETLRSISATKNRRGLTESFFNGRVNWEEKLRETDIYSAMKIFLKKGWALQRLVAVMAVGFGVGMVYYGMPLGVELFPTCVRNSAVSMVRQAGVLSGVVSPLLVAAGKKNGLFSYVVFGVTIALGGLFVICLPETKGRMLCDTMEEEEEAIRDAGID